MFWGIIALILLLVIIGLTIWLLVRQSNICPDKKKLNENCSTTIDCNSGLVCSPSSGATGVTGVTGSICKVATGGVCSASADCGSGLICSNGVCIAPLGSGGQACPCATGFTCVNNICRAIVGRNCTSDTDCATGVCINNICGVTGLTNLTPDNMGNNTWNRCSNSYSTDSDCSRKYTDSSRSSRSYSRSRSDSFTDLTSCTDTNCTDTKYFKTSNCSKNLSSDSIYSFSNCENISKTKRKKCYSSDTLTDYVSSCYSKDDSYIRRGVYVTDASNNDRTLFTSIEEPIIDVVQNGINGLYLLLKNGNIVSNSTIGTTGTVLTTNKKMQRVVRFGTEIIGLDHRGKLYYRNTSNTVINAWNWEHLKNYPKNVEFIDSTNSPYTNLEVLTCEGKAYLYTFSQNWKDGNATNCRKTKNFRYYGSTISRFIDIDERTNIGKTNEGVIIKHIKAAGFYPSNSLVSVLIDDSFTHVRIINSNAYFLFEQC